MGSAPESEDDRQLIKRAREGDSAAREALFMRFERPVGDYLHRIVGERLARVVSNSDLTQEAFIQALDAMRVLPEDATSDDFLGILLQHARWLVGKQVEKHRAFQGESMGNVTPSNRGDTPEVSTGAVTRQDEIEWLMGHIDRLPPKQATILRKRFSGVEFASIAAEFGISEEAAQKRYLRASLALKRLVDSKGRGEDE